MISRWPPFLWPLISLASLLILMGGVGRVETGLLVAGIVLVVLGFAAAMYLALTRSLDRPRPRAVHLALLGLASFYLLCAIGAATAGPGYAVAALAAGLIPLTALALIAAVARRKTATDGGELADESAAAAEDPHPGIGLDDRTPLGDTSQHSDADAA